MAKHHWEILSISLEYLAFFLAAPDFLGEGALENVKRLVSRVLGGPDRWSKSAGDKLGSNIPLIGGAPAGAFVIAVIILDLLAAALLGIGHWTMGKPFTLDYLQSQLGALSAVLGITNIAGVFYVVHLAIHGVSTLGGKGMFFLAGALTFTVSKAIAICVVLEYLGHA